MPVVVGRRGGAGVGGAARGARAARGAAGAAGARAESGTGPRRGRGGAGSAPPARDRARPTPAWRLVARRRPRATAAFLAATRPPDARRTPRTLIVRGISRRHRSDPRSVGSLISRSAMEGK